ncbi:MAG TPA: outer membrane beta-barrel protein [Chitinophagaceae bacterium]|nr:outer membrane beta-barrel protein [Chitinophagaceae bacterium]
MRKIFTLAVILCCLNGYAFAQGTLKGRIIDSTSQQPLGLATITVFKAADTAIITYRLSDPEGNFKVPGIPFDLNCRVVISFSGYSIFRKEFTIPAGEATLDMNTVYMLPDAKSLDEVLVIAERPPVVVKKDTIEFNASAFKTLPNALVEDLLKKLPGVQVDRDGNIAVNGKPVNRILVDGKVFFGDDPKMATRNLPANVIDKVQVTDDKEELLRNGDDNINNVGKVVNITLKKGVKKGWFGKLYGGLGTDELYEAGGIANIYRDTLQISVLGYMNNMNKAGFSFNELMQTGGMDRNRSNSNGTSISIWNNSSGGSGVSINGVNFGGAQNYGGVSTSKGAGFNLNHAPNAKKSLFLQYFHGNVHVNRLTETETQQFNGDTVISNKTRLTGGVVTNAHNIGAGLRLKPDSVTNILFNANYTIGLSNENRISTISSMNNILGPLSAGNVLQSNKGSSYYYRHSLNITRLSKTKKGRRYNIYHSLDVNNRYNDLATNTGLDFYYPTAYDSLAAQLRNERIPRTDAAVSFNYSDPLSKILTFRIGGRYEYGQVTNNINTFSKDLANPGNGDTPDPLRTSSFNRHSNRILLMPGLEFKWKNFTITPGMRALFQYVDNDLASLPAPVKQKSTDLLPALSVTYKQLNLNYSRDIALPSFTYLIPVSDNTNPYFITKGNTTLNPSRRDNFYVNYYFNDPKRSFNISVYANGALTHNDIVQSITVDEKGVQTTMPVNANGSKNFYINYNLYKQYKNNQRFIFSWNTGANYNFNRNRLLYNGESSWQTTWSLNQWAGIGLNWNDKVEWNSNVSLGYNFTRYSSTAFNKLKVQTRWWENELIVRWPKHVIWETQCSYNFNGNVPAGSPKEIVRWNAAVNFTMLRDETGVLRLSVFDILDQNKNISSYTSRNMINTSQTNALTQYFMATFTYNVRPAGVKKKVGGRERLFLF